MSLVLSQLGIGMCLRKGPIELSWLVGSVDGGGGSDGQGQIRGAAGTGTTGRSPATGPGWQKLSPSDRQSADSPKERRRWAAPQVAEALDVALSTVYRVKQRFAEEGLEKVLQDRPQANRPRKLGDRGEAHLIAPRSWPGAGFGLQPSAGGARPLDPAAVGREGGGVGVGVPPCPMRGSESVSKKHSQAVAEEGVVHPQGERGICGQHGGCPGPVRGTS